MDKIRQSFYNAKEGNRRVYESRIDFISHYMCLKVKTIMGSTYTPWTIYSMWAPGYDDAKPVGKPNVQPVLLPVIVAKIIPFEGSGTVPQVDRDNIGSGYREKLNEAIKHKCIYAHFNDRGSIFNMGFKFNCPADLQTLKNMEPIYKEECHVHQFIIPFETAVWNEDNLPPLDQQNSSGSGQNTAQNPAPSS